MRAISQRCPHLSHISAHFSHNDREPSDDADLVAGEPQELVKSLPHLESLTLPLNVLLHLVVWTAAGTQPHLHELGWILGDANVNDYEPRSEESQGPSPKFASGLFQGLQSLLLSIDHKSASLLFSDPTPLVIEDLALELVGAPSARQFMDLLSQATLPLPNRPGGGCQISESLPIALTL